MNNKIRAEHLARTAVVYIRQSTLMQVLEHTQSTERQYNLSDLAKRLGWDASQVEVIDEDLGQSGASATNRTGFQRLAAQVSLGKVGGILSLEVSRLARSSADWHRLLDLCAISDTLIIDDDGVYDPNDFNDRLVLGMKGTMSDAERHVMRLRLRGGMLHKARKGEFAFAAATGYVFDGAAFVLDPDEQVQKAIRLLFKRLRLDGSACGVVRYFDRHKLLFPSRRQHQDAPAETRWQRLTYARVLSVLHNPFYAGAYVYGRRQRRQILVDGNVRRRSERVAVREKWHAFLRDAHPAYITWEEHLENLRRLDENAARHQRLHGRSAAKKGDALLQGLLLCGKCGQRMYPDYFSAPAYICSSGRCGNGPCWSLPARRIDELVIKLFLETIAPAELDLSLAVFKEVERQASDVDRQWKLRLERARYEAGRAERQFNAVEPENRIVARTLETRWNEKLQALSEVEREYEDTKRTKKLELSEADRKAVLALAHDLPKVWNARTTTTAEKKNLLRLLIQDVVLSPVDLPQRATKVRVLWKTGAVSELLVPRPNSGEDHATPAEVVSAIRELAAQRHIDKEIAAELNRRGLQSGLERKFTTVAVEMIRRHQGIPSVCLPGGTNKQPLPERDKNGRYSVRGLVKRFDVTEHIVRWWIESGVITPERDHTNGPFWLTLTPEIEARIADAKRRGNGPKGRRRGIKRGVRPLPLRFPDGRYSTNGIVDRYRITESILRHWVEEGVIVPEHDRPHGKYRFTITPGTEERIQAALARGTGPRSTAKRPHHRPKLAAV